MTDEDADIERMIARRRTIEKLGFCYYETNANASRHNPDSKRTVKSRAGQPNWRLRWPPKDKPKPAPREPKPRPGTALRTIDLVELTLAFAHAGLDVRESRAA